MKEGTVMKRLTEFKRTGAFILSSVCLILSAATIAESQSKNAKRVTEATRESQKAAEVFTEIMNVPDRAIPQKLLDKAEAIAVFPSVIKAGFIIGGRGGDWGINPGVKGGWGGAGF